MGKKIRLTHEDEFLILEISGTYANKSHFILKTIETECDGEAIYNEYPAFFFSGTETKNGFDLHLNSGVGYDYDYDYEE